MLFVVSSDNHSANYYNCKSAANIIKNIRFSAEMGLKMPVTAENRMLFAVFANLLTIFFPPPCRLLDFGPCHCRGMYSTVHCSPCHRRGMYSTVHRSPCHVLGMDPTVRCSPCRDAGTSMLHARRLFFPYFAFP